jgi:predicted RNA polymerase sigma factor
VRQRRARDRDRRALAAERGQRARGAAPDGAPCSTCAVIPPYQLQAAIAALHDEAARAEETDWTQILALYELLARGTQNSIVTLNGAVAVAMGRRLDWRCSRRSAPTRA